jgi:hypothetical protein
MGIKLRMIENAKRTTFYFFTKIFENVGVYSHLHSKFAKSAFKNAHTKVLAV